MDRQQRFVPALVALAGGVAAVAGSYATVGDSPAFVAAPIANATVTLAPSVLVTFAITVLGDLGIKLAYVLGLGLTAVALGIVAGAARVAATRAGRPLAGPVVATVAVGLVAAALSGSAASAVGAAVGTALVATVVTLGTAPDGESAADSRRAVLAGVAALSVGVLAVGGRRVFRTPPDDDDLPPIPDDVAAMLDDAESKSLAVEGLEPLVSDHFYTVDIANVDPRPAREDWSLRIHGAVGQETTYTAADIDAMEHEHRFETLRCVGETLNGRKLDTAVWTGVPLMDLLAAADLQGDYVMLRAADGFYEEFPVDALETGFLAVGMNGRPLPRPHGAPARALIPGHWGEINVKWLTEVEILDEPATGYWEKRGWHGTGPVNTVAKLWAENRLDDGRMEVAGPAYAGTRGIERVEVSTDGGATWNDADLSDPLPADDVWRQWVYRYDPPDGAHEVVVRATDGLGTLQPRDERRAYPSGPSGWVSTTIEP
ncbi:molybdopterin-dependent oxidoreductase [Haloplanus aerogenes]|uniref:Molybdenum-dependent oxidoreductase-like protein n=1 Tax=Haloplanus aerogenes TaxID=660522 RepID=A0A3M0DQJ9_9EURY|nr:molybdopterin-dependent oxidoreductase [Haloplanus aerogenes]AZH24357.1 sulfite oxidase [Haloplanus aerogenes]RMB24008.1 molybdenum-dependent oxidoreductase-like protein [Haloplanus aerogenes]